MPRAKTIFKAALIVGTLDIAGALLQFYIKTGKEPFKPVLTFVASGLLGKTAFTGGAAMIIVGLLIHYCIATAFTLFFFLTIARTRFAREQWFITGILYGAFIWIVMNFLVLPVTKVNRLPQTFSALAIGMGILMVCIGIPLAYMAHKTNRNIVSH